MPDKNIVELIVFALLFLGWVIRTRAERKSAPPRRHPHRPAPEGAPAPETARPVPGRPRADSRGRLEPVPLPETIEAVEPAPKATVAPEMSGGVRLAGELKGIQGIEGLAIGTLDAATAAITEEGARRRVVLVRRLGGPAGAAPRDLARAGMLWSEVLGPPRSLRGPHRGPVTPRTT